MITGIADRGVEDQAGDRLAEVMVEIALSVTLVFGSFSLAGISVCVPGGTRVTESVGVARVGGAMNFQLEPLMGMMIKG